MQRIKRHVGVHHITSWKVLVFVISVIASGIFGTAYSIEAYPQVFKTEVEMENRENIGALNPVVINFSQPIMSPKYSSGIKITPGVAFSSSWENSGKKLIIIPDNFWQPETNYTLNLPTGMNAMLGEIPSRQITFSTAGFPRVEKITPEPNAKDVTLDIEDPIFVNFDRSTEDFYLKFVLSPQSKVSYQNNNEKNQFKILPQEKIEAGAEYKLIIFAKYVKDSDDGYKEIFRSSFTTLPPPPTAWEKNNFSDRLEQAKKYTKARIETGKYIDINLSAQVLSIFENGKIIMSSIISTGKRGMDTPKGEFEIQTKRPRPWSKKYALYMPWFMGFTSQGHGIHELPEWPGGYKEGANHLGIPVSHGCVRLGVGPAKQVYEWSDVGTPVVIY
ncbi:MAG TPA: L,D-transpeptidase family protein [Patescibacteria group bacterium]|nr:L,D-transpeptidase family protein [Patescibacteria group bacterium]